MKGKYTIKDKEYRRALDIVRRELENRGIGYSIVGGGAVQIHIGSLLGNIPELEAQLRRTGDIDIVVDTDLGKMVLMFNELAQTYKGVMNQGAGNALILGVNVNYSTLDDIKGYEGRLVLEESGRKQINFRSLPIDVNIENPELIVAAKLTGSYKPKDVFDIEQLHLALKMRGEKLDEKKISKFLRMSGHEDKIEVFRSIIS